MAKTVFILGAGASKEDGAPLMSEFLDVVHSLKTQPKMEEIKTDIDRVFNAIAKLRDTHYKSYIDLDNIEEVFGAFEMARLIKRLGTYTIDEIETLGYSLNRMIVKTLEECIKLPFEDGMVHPPSTYENFALLIQSLFLNFPKRDCSILTFNYDMGLDYALHFFNIPIDYCLSDSNNSQRVKLLKLHGSINWGRCECGAIAPWYLSSFFQKRHFDTIGIDKFPESLKVSDFRLTIGTNIKEHKHCDQKVMKMYPVLIPPTWNKTDYHGELSRVWSQAAIELAEAENIFIIGYSMPESDLFFRYLFALGTASEVRLQRLWIFNPDSSGEVERRADKIKGRGVERRYRFIKQPFSKAIELIANEEDFRQEKNT